MNTAPVRLPALRVTTLVVAVFGTGARLVEAGFGELGISILGYFTIQSNLMVCVFLSVWAVRRVRCVATGGRNRSRDTGFGHAAHGAVLLYIAITGLVYNILLAPGIDIDGFSGFLLVVNHTVTPLLFAADWVVNQERRRYPLKLIGLWLLYPIAYGVFGSIEGSITGRFRYFFLDFASKSVGRYAAELGLVTAIFIVASLAIVGANRLVVRRK